MIQESKNEEKKRWRERHRKKKTFLIPFFCLENCTESDYAYLKVQMHNNIHILINA